MHTVVNDAIPTNTRTYAHTWHTSTVHLLSCMETNYLMIYLMIDIEIQ